jgi:hypothetical protein
MPSIEQLDTHRKALTVNLDAFTFDSFAEIDAGREVARWFLVKNVSLMDLEWTETNGCVSAEQLRFKPPLQSPLCLSSRQQFSRPDAHDLGPAGDELLTR